MKAFVLVVIGILACSFAYASDVGDASFDNVGFNELLRHGHNYSQTSKFKAPLGLGIDLTLYEIDLMGLGLGVGVDTQYDMNNGVFGAMGKVKVNTTGLINKLIGVK